MKPHALGIDLRNTVFHLVGLDSTGSVVIHKKCSRKQLLAFTANLKVQLIGMEACSGSHFLGRALRKLASSDSSEMLRLRNSKKPVPWGKI